MQFSQKSNRRQTTIILAVVAAMIGLFGFWGCKDRHGRQGAPAGTQPIPEVAVMTVEPQQIVLTTELPGRTATYRIAEIRPQVNGLIQKRLFEEGAYVKVGDVLYQIDPAPLQAALDSAKAALRRSEANLPAIKAREERFKKLLAEKVVSQQDYDDVAAALRQYEADTQYWQSMRKGTQINMEYTKVRAPISGRIGRSSVTEGAIVTAYQPVSLATIQQLDPIYVDLQQSTTELLRLQRRIGEGQLNKDGSSQQKVKLIMPDGAQYPLEGTLQFRDVTVAPGTDSVTLRVVFPNPEGVLLPGMFVRALVIEGVNEQAILIPQQAVSRDPKGNPVALIVDAEDHVQPRPLTMDRAIGDQWLVTGGIKQGDRVIVEGILKVRPGAKVKVASPTAAKPVNGAPTTPQAK